MEIHSVNIALLGLKPWGSEQAVITAFRCELPHAELPDNCSKVGEQVPNVRDLRKAGPLITTAHSRERHCPSLAYLLCLELGRIKECLSGDRALSDGSCKSARTDGLAIKA